MLRLVLCFLLTIPSFVNCYSQKKARFPQEDQLRECEIEIPLYYATKKQTALLESAEKYKDVELVLLTIDKKTGATYKFYYLERFESDFGPSAYLVEKKYLNLDRRPDHVLFLGYNPKKHIFYTSECFNENPASKNLSVAE